MRRVLCVLLLSLPLAFAACTADDSGDPTNPNTIFVLPDESGQASGASAQLLDDQGREVAQIMTTHVVGGTSCPQNLGKLVLKNEAATGDMVATVAVATEGVALDLSATEATVAPGGTSEISLDFNCMSTDNISTQLVLNLEFGGRIGVFNIDVGLTVEGG